MKFLLFFLFACLLLASCAPTRYTVNKDADSIEEANIRDLETELGFTVLNASGFLETQNFMNTENYVPRMGDVIKVKGYNAVICTKPKFYRTYTNGKYYRYNYKYIDENDNVNEEEITEQPTKYTRLTLIK